MDILNSFGTSISSLNSYTSENENVVVSLGSSLSTLYNFRSDNESALMSKASTTFSTLINGVFPGSEILFYTILSNSMLLHKGLVMHVYLKLIPMVNYAFIILIIFFYL